MTVNKNTTMENEKVYRDFNHKEWKKNMHTRKTVFLTGKVKSYYSQNTSRFQLC